MSGMVAVVILHLSERIVKRRANPGGIYPLNMISVWGSEVGACEEVF